MICIRARHACPSSSRFTGGVAAVFPSAAKQCPKRRASTRRRCAGNPDTMDASSLKTTMQRFTTYFDDSDGAAVALEPITAETLDSWHEANADSGLSKWLKTTKFKAKPGDVRVAPNFSDPAEVGSVAFGLESHTDHWSYAALSGTLPSGVYAFDEANLMASEAEANRAALGWGLGSYVFDIYKTENGSEKRLPRLQWPSKCNRALVESALESIFLARDMINTPASDMGPEEIVANVLSIAKMHGASANVIVGDDLLKEGYPAVHTVGRASSRAPCVVDVRWTGGSGSSELPKIALVGKGVAFDTGGLDLKPPASMIGMKKDMGGAAMILALAHMVMSQKLPVQLRLIIPAVENSVSGNSYRPSDVLPTRSGISVENMNTDAEGRLILCDAIFEAAKDSPDVLIDAATLTGAARMALGEVLPALYCDDDAIANAILAAGETEGDLLWRMPLHKPYRKKIESKIADIASAATGPGGSITAALFLKEFVKDTPGWVHIDTGASTPGYLAGPGRAEGGEAFAVRALFRFLHDRYAKAEA